MDFASFALVVGLVTGVVELVKRAFDRDYRAVAIIAAAAVTGGVCGYFGVEGIDVATGLVVGFATSGLVTIATRVGGTKKE